MVLIVAASVVFVLLAVGALFAGAARGSAQQVSSTPVTSESPAPVPSSTATRVLPSVLPTASDLRTCSISTLAKDSRLGTFYGEVTDAATGTVLFSRDGRTAASPGTVQQLETAAAAMKVLGPDYRLTTSVVAGSEPGTIVLVGGGDPTLSRAPEGTQSYYADAPKLSDLADQVTAALAGVPITKIVLDSTYWNSKDAWDSSWSTVERTAGRLSKVTALQVDGDRATPAKALSPRGSDPVMSAGKYFAEALGMPDVPLELGTAPAGAAQLGSVQSQPMSTLVPTMVLTGDATLAESLARVVSKQSQSDGSAASLQKTISAALTSLGLDTKGVIVRDGSGTSLKNAASPLFVTKLVRTLRAGKNDLGPVFDALSIAGQPGLLQKRFAGDNAVAAGQVAAIAGTMGRDYSMAGIATAKDGTELSFALYATGATVKDTASAALDTVATGIYACGSNLTSH